MSFQNLLRQWDVFSHFTDEQLAQLARCLSRNRFPANTLIVKEGEPTQDAYLIETGAVRIQRHTPYGLFGLATLRTGTLFGETSFVDGIPRSGDAFTLADTQLLAINPVAVASLVEHDKLFHLALYWAFWRSLSAKLRMTNEKLTNFFSEGGGPPSAGPSVANAPPGEVHVDLASKRKVFQEQKLSSMEINFLSTLSKEKKYGPGQVIFREGESGHEMYVVLEGRVMISKYIPGAGEEALAFVERGGYFGEMALIDNQPRSAAAKAYEGGAVVLAIPREVLEGILDIHKVSSLRLLTILCNLVASRLRELDDKIISWFIFAGGSGITWPLDD